MTIKNLKLFVYYRNMKKKLLLPLVLSTLLSAEDNALNVPLPDDIKLTAGAYVIANHKTLLNVSSHDGVSGSLDLQKVLKMETRTTSVYFDGYYRFTPSHRVELGYTSLSSSAHSDFGKVYFPGEEYEIDLSGDVDTYMDINTFKLLYTYSFYHNEKVELGLSLGLHVTDIDFGLGASIGSGGNDYTLAIAPPLPVVGARFEYMILPEWSVQYNFDLLYLATDVNLPNMSNVEGIEGYLFDSSLGTEYRLFKNFGLGAALNLSVLEFEFIEHVVDVGLENRVLGFVGYWALYF